MLRMVHQCSKAVKIPIIGCGGIMKVEDVVEYLLAGATAVEVGFANFRNPTAMIGLIEGLEKWCAKKGIQRVAELTGAMLDHPAEAAQAAILLSAGDRQRQRVGDFFGFVIEIEGNGFLEERKHLPVHEPADSERHLNVV